MSASQSQQDSVEFGGEGPDARAHAGESFLDLSLKPLDKWGKVKMMIVKAILNLSSWQHQKQHKINY